jgi:hypothetical protein
MSSTGAFIFLIVAYQDTKFQGFVLEYSDLHNLNKFSIPKIIDRR